MVSKLKSPRRLAALAVFAIIAMSAFGFAAANTVQESNAGDGKDDVSGGAVVNVHYTLDSNGDITTVSFDYTSTVTPDQGFVQLLGTAGTVLKSGTCTAGTSYEWDCVLSTPQAVAPVLELRVVTAS